MPETAIAPAPVPVKPAAAPAPAPAKPAPAQTQPVKAAPKPAQAPVPAKPANAGAKPKPATDKPEETMFDAIDREAGVKKKPEQKKPDEIKTEIKEGAEAGTVDPETGDPEAGSDPEPDKSVTATDPDDPLSTVTEQAKPKVEADPNKPKPTAWQLVREKEKRIKELELELNKPRIDPKTKDQLERAEKSQARLKELEDEIKFVNYEKSQEYKEKYHEPYIQAVTQAIEEVKELKVVDPETGASRPATEQDFWSIVHMGNSDDALEAAAVLFGNDRKANVVHALRAKIKDAFKKAEQAKLEYRTKGSERERQMAEERQKQAETRITEWKQHNEDYARKYPQLFTPEDGDEKGNALLKTGQEMADAAFNGSKPNVKRDAIIRSHAAAFPRLYYKFQQGQERLKELEAKLAEYESSEPGQGAPPSEGGEAAEPTMFDLIDKAGV